MHERIATGRAVLGTLAKTVEAARDDTGQDLLEYGMLAVLIAIFAIAAVTLVGNQINTVMWEYIATNF
jgi:Flp pilus assembly pilin Flp